MCAVAEGWTRAETRRQHRWCEGKGYSNGAPVCGGRVAVLSDTPGEQVCQRCQRTRREAWRDGLGPVIADTLGIFDDEHWSRFCAMWTAIVRREIRSRCGKTYTSEWKGAKL